MAQYVVRVQCGVHMTGCVCVYGASKNVLLGQKQWGADWFVKAGCVCASVREFVCVCTPASISFQQGSLCNLHRVTRLMMAAPL